ncbi:lycopene beta-cyclase CrtY [Sphingomonas mesophila]|uniref:lycopene beta-cyclase CrtY n=1 Tax=Sphingomonas mesophila TaxID=2303576 RepID=UPI000E593BFD|nr:lycopene beta-cyclase CrtY [Sphingomonas mesophila]
MTDPRPALIIAGGGLAGGLAALALAKRRPDVDFLLIEQEHAFGGNHIWSFFDSDVAVEDRALLAPLVAAHWDDHDIRFPRRKRRLALGYNSVRSDLLDRELRQRLRPGQYRLGCTIDRLAPDHVIVGGKRIDGGAVIDARGPGPAPGLDLAWQKFVGRTYRYAAPHAVERPVIMDATVDQSDGYRFLYSLPFAADELMIEDTFYSDTPDLDPEALAAGLDQAAAAHGSAKCVEEEIGVLPILLGGDLAALWPDDGIARLGMAGGFFHPTTGYSLPDALANARLLAEQRDLSGPAIARLLRARAERLWDDRHFFQLLNRMLFRAADPRERYRVLEHFYRLPLATIARFYAARLTALDKLRILSGRPPVAVGRALAAMRKQAA